MAAQGHILWLLFGLGPDSLAFQWPHALLHVFIIYITILWFMLVSDKYVTCWVSTKVDADGVKRLLSEQIGSRIYKGLLWAPTSQPLESKKDSSLIVLMAPSPWKRIEAAEVFTLSTFATPIGPRQNSSRFTQQKRRFSFFYATHRFSKTVILLAPTMSRFEWGVSSNVAKAIKVVCVTIDMLSPPFEGVPNKDHP